MNCLSLIQDLIPTFRAEDIGLTFAEAGLDSFDLLTLRIKVEALTGQPIPDEYWLRLTNCQQLNNYLSDKELTQQLALPSVTTSSQRSVRINMPQMAVSGLSENWLFKELGDIHWTAIANAFCSASDNLLDGEGNRLYATFVRIRLESTEHLRRFQENEELLFSSNLSRSGKSMYFSECQVNGHNKAITASLMSTFAVREGNNSNLLKAEPALTPHLLAEAAALPMLAQEYQQVRKDLIPKLQLANCDLPTTNQILFEMEYALNPYVDINGVGLLYFAAYPLINDVCERAYFQQNSAKFKLESDWATQASTLARDVLYFANCDLNDTIIFQMHSLNYEAGGLVSMTSSLLRKSDRQLLAKVFTVKLVHE